MAGGVWHGPGRRVAEGERLRFIGASAGRGALFLSPGFIMLDSVDPSAVFELGTVYGTRLLGVLVFLFVASRAAKLVRNLMARQGDKGRMDPTIARFAGNSVYWLILIMSGIACLGIFGIETTSFAAVIGAAGLAIGLAFQGSLSNLASGVMLVIFRPFSVGEVVRIAGEVGKVHEVELFTTTLDTPDNRRIIVPNAAVFGGTIENISHHATRRVDVNVGADYGASIDVTREALLKAAARVPDQTDEAAAVLTGLGASSVDWQVRVWIRSAEYFAAMDALTQYVKEELDDAGIGIPYQTIDINLSKD